MQFNQLRTWFERAEKAHTRAHFIAWIVSLPGSVLASILWIAGWWAYNKVRFRFTGSIPIREAAKLAYEKTQGLAFAAEREGKTSDGIIDYYATWLINNGGISGRRTPSTTSAIVPEDELSELTLLPGTKSLCNMFGQQYPIYVDVRITRQSLEAIIKFAKILQKPSMVFVWIAPTTY